MTTNQEGVHAAVRAETGTSGSYLADWHALFDANAIATGPWGPRLLAWINQTLGTSYTDTAEAMQAFAVDQGFTRWNDMNTLVLASSGALDLLAGADGLALDFTDDFYQADTGFYGSAAIVGGGTQDGYDSSPDQAASSLLTYTSPSLKMTMGPSGTLRFGAHNYALNTADGSQWTSARTNVTTTNGVSDPNGGTSAWTLTATGANGRVVQTVSGLLVGTAYSLTVYLRRRTGTGTVNWEDNDVGLGAEITGLTSAWQAYTYPETTISSTSWYIGFRLATSGDEIDIAFPHLRRTPSDDTYLATTSAARYALPYQWTTAGVLEGILVEEARTNALLQSQTFDVAWIALNASVTVNAATAPDGTTTADFLKEDSSNSTHQVFQSATPGTGAYTWSFYAKPNGRTFVKLIANTGGGANDSVVFDLSGSGSIGTTGSSVVNPSIISLSNGWYRVAATVTGTVAAMNIQLMSDGSTTSYTGDNTSGIYLWGAQIEAGSFATSYIPTIGSTVTRAADNISLGTAAFPWSSTAFTVFGQFTRFANQGSNPLIDSFDGGGTRIYYYTDPGSIDIPTGGSLNVGTGSTNTDYKLAFAAQVNDVVGVRDGSVVATDTTYTPTTAPPTFTFGKASSFSLNGYIAKIAIFPTRKSNADLQTLTT